MASFRKISGSLIGFSGSCVCDLGVDCLNFGWAALRLKKTLTGHYSQSEHEAKLQNYYHLKRECL